MTDPDFDEAGKARYGAEEWARMCRDRQRQETIDRLRLALEQEASGRGMETYSVRVGDDEWEIGLCPDTGDDPAKRNPLIVVRFVAEVR